jgi:hypothetical protein
MQSSGILKLIQKVKSLLMFHPIDLENLANFRHREGHQFECHIWVIENFENMKWSWAHLSAALDA